MTTSVPVGYVDDGGVAYSGGYGELVDALLEYVPDLLWPMNVRTYSRMRWDPQCRAVLSAYSLPIRRATWAVDPAGCRDEVVAKFADEIGLPVLGADDKPGAARRRGVVWSRHLRLALLKLTFGHMPFERTFDTSDGTAARLQIAERMPQTIAQIWVNPDGTLDKISQNALAGGSSTPPQIPAKNLVWYAHDREGSAWTGQSLLRAAYAPWLIKHELWRVHATSIRRFGMGIPEVQAPAGATPAQIAEAQRLASGVRAGDSAGVGLPNGFTLALKGLVGSTPDALAFVKYLDQQITRMSLSSLLDQGDTTHGSRSLGETFMDLLLMALQAIADDTADDATSQISVPWVDVNYSDDEPAPRIVCGDVGSEHEVTAQTVQLLLSAGGITPDPELEAYLRRQYKLPDRDPSTPWVAPHNVGDPMTAVPAGADAPNGETDPAVTP